MLLKEWDTDMANFGSKPVLIQQIIIYWLLSCFTITPFSHINKNRNLRFLVFSNGLKGVSTFCYLSVSLTCRTKYNRSIVLLCTQPVLHTNDDWLYQSQSDTPKLDVHTHTHIHPWASCSLQKRQTATH